MSYTAIGPTYNPTTTNSTAGSDICVLQTEESIRMKTACSTSKNNYWFGSKNAFARFQASTAVLLRFSLFRGFTMRWLVLVYWRFGTIISIPSSRIKQSTPWPLKMGPMGCTGTSVNTYQTTLRKTQKSVELKHDFNIW